MERMQSLLSSHQNKHLIIGVSIVQFEAFITKAFNGFLHSESIETMSYENIVIKAVFNKTMTNQQSLFISSSSLALFFKAYYSLDLDSSLDLKAISLTFLEPQSDYPHIELFSPCNIYAIRGWDYNCEIQFNEIDLRALPSNLFIKKKIRKKEKIFNIQKMINKNKKTTRCCIQRMLKKEKTLGANSLISISNEISLYVQRKQSVTLSQLIQYIIEYVRLTNKSNPNKKEVSLMNIHRRVYDSINIMCALGIMKKENNHIAWINKNYLNSPSSLSEQRQLNQLKQQQFKAKLSELSLYSHFYQSNQSKGQIDINDKDKVYFPLDYVDHLNSIEMAIPYQKNNNNSSFTAIDLVNNHIISYSDFLERITSSLKEPQISKDTLSNDYSTDTMSKNLPSIFDIDFGLEDEKKDFFFKTEDDPMDINEYKEGIF